MTTALRPALILSALLLLVPATAAQVAGHHRHPAAQAHKKLRHAADKLGLSDSQREQVKAVAQAHRDQMSSLRQSARAAKEALEHVLATTPQDADAVRTAARAVSAAHEDLAVARGARRADVRSVLTPEQQAQVAAHEQAKAERHAEHEQKHADRKADKLARHKAHHAAGSTGPK